MYQQRTFSLEEKLIDSPTTLRVSRTLTQDNNSALQQFHTSMPPTLLKYIIFISTALEQCSRRRSVLRWISMTIRQIGSSVLKCSMKSKGGLG